MKSKMFKGTASFLAALFFVCGNTVITQADEMDSQIDAINEVYNSIDEHSVEDRVVIVVDSDGNVVSTEEGDDSADSITDNVSNSTAMQSAGLNESVATRDSDSSTEMQKSADSEMQSDKDVSKALGRKLFVTLFKSAFCLLGFYVGVRIAHRGRRYK